MPARASRRPRMESRRPRWRRQLDLRLVREADRRRRTGASSLWALPPAGMEMFLTVPRHRLATIT